MNSHLSPISLEVLKKNVPLDGIANPIKGQAMSLKVRLFQQYGVSLEFISKKWTRLQGLYNIINKFTTLHSSGLKLTIRTYTLQQYADERLETHIIINLTQIGLFVMHFNTSHLPYILINNHTLPELILQSFPLFRTKKTSSGPTVLHSLQSSGAVKNSLEHTTYFIFRTGLEI